MVEEEGRKILTPEEEIRWFLKHLDEITLEMRRGVFRVIFSYSNKRKKYELRIYRESSVLFFAEGALARTPVSMLEDHTIFLRMAAKTLRKVVAAVEELLEKAPEEEQEEEQEEEREE